MKAPQSCPLPGAPNKDKQLGRDSPSTPGSHRPWQAGAVMLGRWQGGLKRAPAGLCPGTRGSVLQGMARSGLVVVPKCRGQHNNGDSASRRVSARRLHAGGAWSRHFQKAALSPAEGRQTPGMTPPNVLPLSRVAPRKPRRGADVGHLREALSPVLRLAAATRGLTPVRVGWGSRKGAQ